MKESAGKEELLSLIPHRDGMVLISRIKRYDLEDFSLDAEYDITEDCVFYDQGFGGVPAWAGFEFLAQSISALVGIRRHEIGENARLGFLLSVSAMKMAVPVLPAGCTVELKVKRINRIDMVYTFECLALLDGAKVLEGKITTLDVDEETQARLLKGE